MKLPRNRDQAKTPRREAKPLLLNPRIPLAPASLPRPQIQSSGTTQRSHLLDPGFRTFAASSPQASMAFASSFHTLSYLEYTCERLEPAAESLPPPTAVDPRYLHHLAFPQCRPWSATEGRIEADFNGNAASQHRLIGSSPRPTLPQNRQGCEKSHSTKALVWYRRKANRFELPGTVRSTEYGVQPV